jgi:hypothetical protein
MTRDSWTSSILQDKHSLYDCVQYSTAVVYIRSMHNRERGFTIITVGDVTHSWGTTIRYSQYTDIEREQV